MAPFSDTRPKASFPVGSRNLLDRAVGVIRPFVEEIALNVSGHVDWFATHVPPGVRTFEEESEPLGTAGGLYNMREWIDGRDVVVLNADSVLFGDVADFIDRRHEAPTRLLVTPDRTSPDFDGMWRFVGLSTMDAATLARIGPDTGDLYRDLWKRQLADGEVRAGEHLQRCIVDANARFDLLSTSVVPTERSAREPQPGTIRIDASDRP